MRGATLFEGQKYYSVLTAQQFFGEVAIIVFSNGEHRTFRKNSEICKENFK